MKSKSIIPTIIAIIVGIAVLYFLANNVLSSHAYPSLGEFMASSSPDSAQEASTTDDIAATTSAAEFSSLPQTGHSNTAASSSAPLSLVGSNGTSAYSILRTPTSVLHVQIANTPALREQGLSGHAPLKPDQGMLFIFPKSGTYGFWMKDMLFPLDMVWIRSDKTVASVTENISPDTYPSIFFPPGDIQFVLELNAGAAKKSGIATSTKLVF